MSPQRRTTLLSLAPALPLSLPCPTLLPAALLPPLLSPRRRAPSPPLPGGARLGKARAAALGEASRGRAAARRARLGEARAAVLGEVRRGRAAARRARRGPRGGIYGGSRAPGMSLPLSPTLSLLSVLPHLCLSHRRGAARRRDGHTAVDPGGRVDSLRRGSTRQRIQGGCVDPGRPRRLPAPATWIHTAAAWIHGKTAPTRGVGVDPAADPAKRRPRRRIQRGAVAPVLGWDGLVDGLENGLAGGFLVFFCFFKRLTAADILTCPPR